MPLTGDSPVYDYFMFPARSEGSSLSLLRYCYSESSAGSTPEETQAREDLLRVMYEIGRVSFVPSHEMPNSPERNAPSNRVNSNSAQKSKNKRRSGKRRRTDPNQKGCGSESVFGARTISGEVEYFTSFDATSIPRDGETFAQRE